MNKAELEENIAKLEKYSLGQKVQLENGFDRLQEQMKPGNILRNVVKQGIVKFKSFLHKFSTRSNELR